MIKPTPVLLEKLSSPTLNIPLKFREDTILLAKLSCFLKFSSRIEPEASITNTTSAPDLQPMRKPSVNYHWNINIIIQQKSQYASLQSATYFSHSCILCIHQDSYNSKHYNHLNRSLHSYMGCLNIHWALNKG